MARNIASFSVDQIVYNYNWLVANPGTRDYSGCQQSFQDAINRYLITEPKAAALAAYEADCDTKLQPMQTSVAAYNAFKTDYESKKATYDISYAAYEPYANGITASRTNFFNDFTTS